MPPLAAGSLVRMMMRDGGLSMVGAIRRPRCLPLGGAAKREAARPWSAGPARSGRGRSPPHAGAGPDCGLGSRPHVTRGFIESCHWLFPELASRACQWPVPRARGLPAGSGGSLPVSAAPGQSPARMLLESPLAGQPGHLFASPLT